MNNNKLFIAIIFILFSTISCTKSTNQQNIRANAEKNSEAKKYSETIREEYNQYLLHAKTSKSEYEMMSYIDNLPLIKKTVVETYGGLQNWNKYLSWLKKNDSREISFNAQGVPMFKRTSHYPEHDIESRN